MTIFFVTECVRGLSVDEENGCYILQFETKPLATNLEEAHVLVKLRTQTVKDAAGLYTVLKSYNDNRRAK